MKPPSHDLLKDYAPLTNIDVGALLKIHVAPDVFALWNVWEEESGSETPIPFWAVPWPAALLTAEYLWSHQEIVREKRVLDLGCGSGIVGISASLAGSRKAVCNDIDPIALHVTSLHASVNTARIDLNSTDYIGKAITPSDFDVIFVADLFYERACAETTLQILRNACRSGAQVYVADAERAFVPTTGIRLLAQKTLQVNNELEGKAMRNVRLLQLTDS